MKKITKLVISISIIFAVILAFIINYKQASLKNTVDLSALKDVPVTCLEPTEYIELPDQIDSTYALTPTGLCFDEVNKEYFVGNYGKAKKEDAQSQPSIVNFSHNFSDVNYTILLDEGKEIDIQGVTYDKTNSTLWYTDGEYIVNCDSYSGEEIRRFSIGIYSKYKPNGLCIDTKNDSLWVLCMYKYLLHFDKNGNLLGKFKCEYIGQDHICIDTDGLLYISAGTDYHGDNNFVICMDREANILMIYRVKESYAIEGIALHDKKLYVVNDGIYHEAKIRKNYVQVYDMTR